MKIQWYRPEDQSFENGLDRGVLYPYGSPAVPWNGLISVEDGGEASVKELWLDSIKYLVMVGARNWKGKLSAYTYPDEFGELIGVMELGDGLYADSQVPDSFCLSYRTLVQTEIDQKQHYKIHLIYEAVATMTPFTNETLSASGSAPTAFDFDLNALPQPIPKARPTAHMIVDSRKVAPEDMEILEGMLYGTESTAPMFPTIQQLVDLLALGDNITIVDNGDGTWTATGANKNVQMTSATGFQINNVNTVGPTNGVYTISSTP